MNQKILTQEEYSYIIWMDNINIFVKNGSTGTIDYKGTDTGIVIQKVIDTMSEGQTLFIKRGIYNLSKKLTINKPINIKGEAVTIQTGLNPPIINGTILTRAGDILEIIATNKYYYNTISNIGLNGVDRSGIIMNLKNFHGILENIIVWKGDIGILMQDSWLSTFYSVAAFQCNYGAKAQTSGCNNMSFYGCKFTNNYIMGFLHQNGFNTSFFGCDFEQNGKYGISIDGNTARNTSLFGCYFEANPTYNSVTKLYSKGAHIIIGENSTPSIISIIGCNLGRMETSPNIITSSRINIVHGYDIFVANCQFYQNLFETTRSDITNDAGSDIDMVLMNCRSIHDGNWVIDGTYGMMGIKTFGNNPNEAMNTFLITQNNVMSDTFSIDSTGIKTVIIPHGLAIRPNIQDCQLTILQDTAVDDWTCSLLTVVSTDVTNVTAKINISLASKSIGATARLALRVQN